MINLFLISTYFLIFSVRADEICLQCNTTYPQEDAKVEEFCTTNGGNMSERCCIRSKAVIGLDLRLCHLKTLNVSKSNLTDLIMMDLQDNELQKLDLSDLTGLLSLEYLYLPENISCPGDTKAWNETSKEHNMTSCCDQRNPCIYLNISCTDNGECLHTGPGTAKCICKPGHYGYKCMNQGEFPVTSFSTSIAVGTVVLSILLWFAQGRDAYKKRIYVRN